MIRPATPDEKRAVWAAIAPPERIDLWLNKDFIEGNRVIAKSIQVRSGPGIQYEVVGTLERGAPVMPRGEEGDWCKIEPPSSMVVWVKTADLAEIKPQTTPIREVATVAAPAPAPVAPPPPAVSPAPEPIAEHIQRTRTETLLSKPNKPQMAMPQPCRACIAAELQLYLLVFLILRHGNGSADRRPFTIGKLLLLILHYSGRFHSAPVAADAVYGKGYLSLCFTLRKTHIAGILIGFPCLHKLCNIRAAQLRLCLLRFTFR